MCQGLTSQWDLMGPHSTAHEVLSQGRCKPVFTDWQTHSGNRISSDHHNNIVLNTSNGSIILDSQILVKSTMRDQYQLPHYLRRISTTTMMTLDILPKLSTMLLLKPLVSNHVKIALWERASNVQSPKSLYPDQKF